MQYFVALMPSFVIHGKNELAVPKRETDSKGGSIFKYMYTTLQNSIK